ncbi:MAG TPA: alpha/beta hydrolase [Candidatus Methanoperedens sp.]
MENSNSHNMQDEDNYTSIWQDGGEIKLIQLKNGVSLRYLEIGTGRPLILLHTLRTQLEYFQGLVPLLKNDFHIYAVDLPGHGRSSLVQNAAYDELFFRQSIIAFIEKLDLKNVVIAGESIGAVLALTAAAEMPDRIAQVFALNPYDYGEKFGGGIRRSRYGYIIGLFRVFKSHTLEIRSILKLLLSGGFVHAEKLPDHLLSEFNRTGERPGYRNMEYLLFKNWRSWLNAVNLYERILVPVTLVYGESDWSRPEEREDRKNRLARAKLLTIPGAGHFSALEDPQQIAQILKA